MNATSIIWRAAGSPTGTTDKTGKIDSEQHDGDCWWCGQGMEIGRPVSCLPATFPWPLKPASPHATHLCMACGWTLCERVELPSDYARPRLEMKAKTGRRQVCSINGEKPGRWLILELDSGNVGVWSCGPSAASEKPWISSVKTLRSEPLDVGPCKYQGHVGYSDISLGPIEKFRAYHHIAWSDCWRPCTDSDKQMIRSFLTSPPAPPWACVIGDGKKHHAIEAARIGAATIGHGLSVAYFQGTKVEYSPMHLDDVINSVERMITAGAGDDEIESGEYLPRGLDWIQAHRINEPVLSEVRGSPILNLALYLRRNRKQLKEMNDAVTG